MIDRSKRATFELTEDEAKDFGCTYCQWRHFSCDHHEDNQPFHFKCKWFTYGKCFSCAYQLANNMEPVEGICDDTHDFGGCPNYKE